MGRVNKHKKIDRVCYDDEDIESGRYLSGLVAAEGEGELLRVPGGVDGDLPAMFPLQSRLQPRHLVLFAVDKHLTPTNIIKHPYHETD